MQFIDLQAQYKHLQDKIDARIRTVLEHGKYIMGPEVQELEQQLAEYVGVKHAITCANGTDALQLAMMAFDIKAGDAVFCPLPIGMWGPQHLRLRYRIHKRKP